MIEQIRVADNQMPGLRTFYIPSDEDSNVEYSVQFIRRAGMKRWTCQCKDFFYRKEPTKRNCKHIKRIRLLVQEYHGVVRLVKAIRAGFLAPRPPQSVRPEVSTSVREFLRKEIQ
jgi:hypothetical protein